MKYLSSILIFISMSLTFSSCAFMNQEQVDDENIGKEVSFQQPIVYIERQTKAIVPIIAEIKKEITGLHVKYRSELKNEYIPSNTIFTIVDAYVYSDFFNKPTLYYILLNKDTKYILSEGSLNRLQEPTYQNATIPIKILDNLYKQKYENIQIKFYSSTDLKKYHQGISVSQFEDCKVQEIKDEYSYIQTTVNFRQLACLYSKLWDGMHSEQYPVKFEVIE